MLQASNPWLVEAFDAQTDRLTKSRQNRSRGTYPTDLLHFENLCTNPRKMHDFPHSDHWFWAIHHGTTEMLLCSPHHEDSSRHDVQVQQQITTLSSLLLTQIDCTHTLPCTTIYNINLSSSRQDIRKSWFACTVAYTIPWTKSVHSWFRAAAHNFHDSWRWSAQELKKIYWRRGALRGMEVSSATLMTSWNCSKTSIVDGFCGSMSINATFQSMIALKSKNCAFSNLCPIFHPSNFLIEWNLPAGRCRPSHAITPTQPVRHLRPAVRKGVPSSAATLPW